MAHKHFYAMYYKEPSNNLIMYRRFADKDHTSTRTDLSQKTLFSRHYKYFFMMTAYS